MSSDRDGCLVVPAHPRHTLDLRCRSATVEAVARCAEGEHLLATYDGACHSVFS